MAGTSKTAKKSKIVVLTLTTQLLSRFPTSAATQDNAIKSEKATPSGIPESSAEDKSSEDNGTPIPANGAVQDAEATPSAQTDAKKKRPPPNPNARKRAPPAIDPDAPIRDRARPGPKKRSRGYVNQQSVTHSFIADM